MNFKIKIITGYRNDQAYSIDAEEAHKAYYLFLHPEERGIFNTGLALRGSEIQKIEPDYQGTMGWNAMHKLESEDWNEIRSTGADRTLRQICFQAKALAKLPNPQIDKLFSEAVVVLPPFEEKRLGNGMLRIAEIIR